MYKKYKYLFLNIIMTGPKYVGRYSKVSDYTQTYTFLKGHGHVSDENFMFDFYV